MMISGFYKSFDIPSYVNVLKTRLVVMLKAIKACALSVSELHLNHAFFILYITQNN